MDDGMYSAAEVKFREAYEVDSFCALAALTYGRIVQDLDLQKRIYAYCQTVDELSLPEEKLRQVYLELLKMMIERSEGQGRNSEQRLTSFKSMLSNLKWVVHRYPGESYILAEYIEVIHLVEGAQAALDSLEYYGANLGYRLPMFLEGYRSTLLLELDMKDAAQEVLKSLSPLIKKTPKYWILWSDYFLVVGKSKKAKRFIDKALQIDPRNVDAIRIRARIDQVL